MAESYGTWETDSHSLKIRYELALMESIRRAAMEGLQKIPRRGLEVGGVLFGTREADTVTLSQWRAIECEHAHGPGFLLSENDERGLRELLDRAAEDPGLAGLVPAGWFRSRCQGGVELEAADLRLHDAYFPESWQVVLVIRPFLYEPARAGFFLREADGTVRAGASYREFTLAQERPRRLPLDFDPSRRPRRAPPPGWRPPPETGDREPPGREPAFPAAPPRPTPVPPRPAGRHWTTVGKIAGAALGVVALVLLLLPKYQTGLSTRGPALDLRDLDGQLVVEWNRADPTVLEAPSAILRIADGGRRREWTLSRAELRSGSLTYQRRSGNVQCTLILPRPGRRPLVEHTRFVGEPPPPTGPPPGAAASAGELARLQQELQQETRRQAELEKRIQRLRRALGKP